MKTSAIVNISRGVVIDQRHTVGGIHDMVVFERVMLG